MEFYEKDEESGFSELVLSKEFSLSNPKVISIEMSMEDINGIYTGKARGGNYISGVEMDLYYEAIRIESNKEGILLGPCLENGDYDPDNLVQCVFNKETKQYEGKARRESGNHWMELNFTAQIYEVYKKPRAKVAYSQPYPQDPLLEYYMNMMWKNFSIKRKSCDKTSGESESPPPSEEEPRGRIHGTYIPQEIY